MHAYDGDAFLDVPRREGKPRSRGLTHVIDKGQGGVHGPPLRLSIRG